ncbi:MAG: leucine-rich repeat protein, partial [Bacteroidales bacterium]|nr:leucine-rich repeat protein [Bacteroidales bacterium]
IPGSVTEIGHGAFWGCTGLMSVTMQEGVTSIGQYAFCRCSGLTSVTIPESVTEIGYRAFTGTSIGGPLYNSKIFAYMPENYSGEYAIPSGIRTIAGGAFEKCTGLASVTLPESVTEIGYSAFNGSSIGSPLYNSRIFAYMPGDYSGEYAIPSGIQTIAGGAFEECTGLTSVTIPESVIEIGKYAFRGCWLLTSVTIPESMTEIGHGVFEWSGLTSVTIPEGVTTIREWAFDGCALRSVTLPASLDTIVGAAFNDCEYLLDVYSLAKEPPYCEPGYNDIGDRCDHPFVIYSATLYVPRGCKSAYQSAREWRKFANIIEITTAKVTLRANDGSMGLVVGGGEFNLDEQITVAAIPNPGYYFVRWDDGNTANPRILTVTGDITLTAIFAKNGNNPSDPSDPLTPPTANESALTAAPIAYVQGRTAYISDGLGEVEAFTAAGQRVYRGTDRTLTLPRPGIYVLRVVADGRRCKVVVK